MNIQDLLLEYTLSLNMRECIESLITDYYIAASDIEKRNLEETGSSILSQEAQGKVFYQQGLFTEELRKLYRYYNVAYPEKMVLDFSDPPENIPPEMQEKWDIIRQEYMDQLNQIYEEHMELVRQQPARAMDESDGPLKHACTDIYLRKLHVLYDHYGVPFPPAWLLREERIANPAPIVEPPSDEETIERLRNFIKNEKSKKK